MLSVFFLGAGVGAILGLLAAYLITSRMREEEDDFPAFLGRPEKARVIYPDFTPRARTRLTNRERTIEL